MDNDLEEDLKRFFILQFDEETIENIKNRKKNPFKSYYGKMINEMWKNDKEINKEKELINFLFKTSINEIKKKEEGFMENINTSFQILNIPKNHQSNLFQYIKSDEEYVPSVSDTDFSINQNFLRMLNSIDYDFCKNIFDLGIKYDAYFRSVWYDYTYKIYCLRLKYLDKIIYDKPINQSIIINKNKEQIQTSKFLIEFKSFNKNRKEKNVTYYLDTERELCSCQDFFNRNIVLYPNRTDNIIKNYLGKPLSMCKHLLAYKEEINKEKKRIVYNSIEICPICHDKKEIKITTCDTAIKEGVRDDVLSEFLDEDKYFFTRHSICLECYKEYLEHGDSCPLCRRKLLDLPEIDEDIVEYDTLKEKIKNMKGIINLKKLEECLKKKERKKIEKV